MQLHIIFVIQPNCLKLDFFFCILLFLTKLFLNHIKALSQLRAVDNIIKNKLYIILYLQFFSVVLQQNLGCLCFFAIAVSLAVGFCHPIEQQFLSCKFFQKNIFAFNVLDLYVDSISLYSPQLLIVYAYCSSYTQLHLPFICSFMLEQPQVKNKNNKKAPH